MVTAQDSPSPVLSSPLQRLGWLRAAILGANDGIVSTASLIAGVAAAGSPRDAVLLAGSAALAAGALSMAAGEYVSVSSQADAEAAALARERCELEAQPEAERQELTNIYIARGLDPELARRVAQALESSDRLGAHARDELGISEVHAARPIQAAFASAAAFTAGAVAPLLTASLVPVPWVTGAVMLVSVVALGLLGALGARAGGARPGRPALRVMVWGVVAMAVTAAVGRLAGPMV